MRTVRMTIWVMVVVGICVFNLPKVAEATLVLNDGETHDIDYVVGCDVEVKDSSQGHKTTVNILSGGSIDEDLKAYDNSQVNMSGGSINWELEAYDNSQIDFSGGTVELILYATENSQINMSGGSTGHYLYACGNSQVNMSGGSIGHNLEASDNARVNVSGGEIANDIYLWGDGIITMYGSGFAIDGQPMNYGQYFASDYANGFLTGTLANGDLLNNNFYIYDNASIALIPEPTTLLLLGLGGLALMKKH